MSFVWSEYHRLCEILLQTVPSGLEEATFRCICSRAYYAAFCSARDVAHQLDGLYITGFGDDHGIVYRHFKDHPDEDHYQIGRALRRLRDNRTKADYEGNASIVKVAAESSITDAKFVLDTLAKLTP